MLVQWMHKQYGHNFGDYLSTLLEQLFTDEAWGHITRDQASDYHLVGSVLDDNYLRRSAEAGRLAVFYGCGFRGKPLTTRLLQSSRVVGVRGPISRDAVLAAGGTTEVIGDPALLVSLLVPKASSNGLVLLMPHINDPRHPSYSTSHYGFDLLASPAVRDRTELLQRIDQVSGANFVLAGAMHAAVVSYAFGVPFAFFDDGHRDCPAKWRDWALSVGLRDPDIAFHKNVVSGRNWYDKIKGRLKPVQHGPLLEAAEAVVPISKSIRAKFRLMAKFHSCRKWLTSASKAALR